MKVNATGVKGVVGTSSPGGPTVLGGGEKSSGRGP